MTQTVLESETPTDYKIFLKEIKDRILSSQTKAAIAVNRELITLYWEVGKALQLKQQKQGWGAKIVEKLSNDLKYSFPNMKGFSVRNIHFMVQFAKVFSDFEIVKQLVSQIPWGHNILIMQRLNLMDERLWYVKKLLKTGGVEAF